MNTRTQALAREDESIQRNVATIEASKPARTKANALQQMASRLNVEPARLLETLKSTVFAKANDEEVTALIIIANEYQLNPLLKEIYAFPSRGGIMPMIGYDGWLAIANRHPEYDGYDHNEIFVGDTFIGVESIFHRKDRSHPTKKAVYLEEFKMATEPWKQKPRHMCQIRSFCQGARIAFGVTGVYVEGVDEDIDVQPIKQASVPTLRQLQQQEAQQQRELEPNGYDTQSGEVFDDAEADAQIEREAEGLNGQGDQYEEQEADTGNDVEAALDEPRWKQHYRETLENVMVAQSIAELNAAEKEFVNHRATYGDEAISIIEREIANAKKRLGAQ